MRISTIEKEDMTPTNQLLWQIGVQIASVMATLILAILAIWGSTLKSRWAGPKLELALHDPDGERIDLTNGDPARFYHLRVRNKRRSAPAQNVRVVLTKITRPAADGTLSNECLSGPIQLTWQHTAAHPQYPTLGPDMICDIGCVIKDKGFGLSTYIIPNNFRGDIPAGQKISIEVIALADNAESKPMSVEMAWDGGWSEDTITMRNHFVIKDI